MMHQGWTNHTTWHMNALVDNDRYLYFKRKLFVSAHPFTETTAKQFVIDNSDHLPKDTIVLEDVNWHEIAEDWNSLED